MIHPRILLVFFCWLFAWTGVAMGADFFVATNGNDMWSGSLASPNAAHSDGPFATLKSARDAMRRARATGRLAGGGTVWIRGGIYSCESSFELTALDSGGPRAPILYRAYSNEIPRLVGGRKVGGFAPVTDDAAKMRLALEARAHVLQVNLREQGVTNFGRFQSRGFGRPTSPAHLELFFDQFIDEERNQWKVDRKFM